ncbi:ABC transporter ATP-binding protein [Marispirochaeta sp.]|jgi:iron complex transport system ATP-binding protein|uniref:ABC transporter ATP-binding protein n=1 Tax=Marispirochaeta sp. TaxID=2038653 RepID=UPI0029C8CE46|nr:ABC transporter ATP-binding protein [Marispirochaeta sp.]
MILKVDSVSFNYRSTPILEDVSFELKAGEICAVLGPNGAGKTTLLRTVNGILNPKQGTVFLEDTDLATVGPREIARKAAYVAQRSEPGRITVFDAVLLGRKPHITFRITSRDIQKTHQAIDMLDLNDLVLRYADELSGGEYQKVCIARALAQDPKLILLDEPTSSLDLYNQIEILTILRRIAREFGTGVLMTIHDLNTAFRYADSFIFLKGGRIYRTIRKEEIAPDIILETYRVPVEIYWEGEHPYMVPKDMEENTPTEIEAGAGTRSY